MKTKCHWVRDHTVAPIKRWGKTSFVMRCEVHDHVGYAIS